MNSVRAKEASVLSALALGVFLCFGFLGNAVAADELQILSSDGTYVPVPESASSGFNGSFGRKNLSRAEAGLWSEIPSGRMTPAEVDELRLMKAPVPYYLRNQEAAPENTIGQDVRQRIYPNASGYPERAIGQITFRQGTSAGFICTGWMISPNTVATAAHCLHGGPGKGFSTNIQIFPGRDAGSNPFGGCTARSLFVPATWTTRGAQEDDFGAFKLNCSVGNATGWFGYMNLGVINNVNIAITGYPGDKPSGTAWSGSGLVIASTAGKVRYVIDTAGGMSGSPVFQPDRTGSLCTGPCALGIHAYGTQNGSNSGTRINSTVLALLNAARNAP